MRAINVDPVGYDSNRMPPFLVFVSSVILGCSETRGEYRRRADWKSVLRGGSPRVLVLLVAWVPTLALARDPYMAQRDRMVEEELITAGISSPRVIEAMRLTPRHLFVLPTQREQAYFDMALPIGEGQTISPPFVVASMTQALEPQPSDRVLEVGTGSGYQAAVLSGLVDEVYSIEIVAALARRAERTLQKLGYLNVHTKIGDGYQGWPEHAPFNKIIVTCSPEDVPMPLVEQLAEGGCMVIPLGERFQQRLYRLTKAKGKLDRKALEATFFVPMTGLAEAERRVRPDMVRPQLAHSSFEESLAPNGEPAGWYYVRQGHVEADKHAPDGAQCLAFSNATIGRSAHAMQAFGVDGRQVKKLVVSCSVRGRGLAVGQNAFQQGRLLCEFYGENRDPVGENQLGPWTGSFDWTRRTTQIPVPAKARLAVIGIGLFGGTGDIWFDQVEVTAAAP